MAINAHVKNGKLLFKSAYHRAYFQKQFEGKNIKIEEEDEFDTLSSRRFFEGPVVKYFFYQHDPEVFKTFSEARESLKKKFNPKWIYDLDSKNYSLVAGSTSGKPKKWWANKDKTGFLDRIENYFRENGYEFPDSAEYNDWLKHAPMVNEEFPPMLVLIETYNNKLRSW